MSTTPTYDELAKRVQQLEGIEAEYDRVREALAERVKELHCVHSMARLIETPEISMNELLQGVAELIPPAWLSPEGTCARVLYRGRVYQTGGYQNTDRSQRAVFLVNGVEAGAIEVYRTDPAIDEEEPFLEEEQTLLEILAERLGRVVERMHAQKTITESERKYEALFEQSIEGLFLHDLDGKILDANRVACLQTGYTRKKLLQMSVFDLHPEESRKDLPRSEIIRQWKNLNTLQRISIEAVHQRKDGSTMPVQISTGRVLEEDGGLMLAITQDITEKRQSERAMAKSAEALKKAQSVAHVGSWEWDIKSGTLEWSDEMYRIFGVERGEFTENLRDVIEQSIHPEDRDAVDASNRSVMNEKKPIPVEYRIIRPDGEVRTVWAEAGELGLDHEGNPASLTGIVMDITERKRVENELREAKAILQAAMDNSQAGIAIAEAPDGRLRYVNEAGLLIRGGSVEKIVNGVGVDEYVSSWRLLDLDGRTLERDEVPLARALLFGEINSREFVVRRSDEEDRIVWANAAPIYDENNEIAAAIVIFLDITDRKDAERERETLREHLAQAHKLESVGLLAGGVAHDFNNMLSVIIGNAELLLSQLDPKDANCPVIQEIQQAAQRSADLTHQLLAFARKQTIAPKSLDLNATIDSMLNMLKRLIGEDIDLQWMLEAGLDPIHMDPAQIDQLLANLVVNARDAIGHNTGTITIETARVAFDSDFCDSRPGYDPGKYVMLAISDDGCGMDEEHQKRVFEPFFTTKTQGAGTGLGLATVYGIVKQNDGLIHVYSEPDRGTTFRIYFPANGTSAIEPRTGADTRPGVAKGTETILMVEDEPGILSMGKRMLESLGYRVLPASGPAQAIERAEEYRGTIDLLITDVVMPEMNGLELADRLRLAYPAMERLFMSGYTANVIAHHGVLEGGVHFVQKPFSLHDLSRKIREALEGT